jgi:two-component system response regulator MprA
MSADARVLVVDDEPAIRATVCEMLDMAGYDATSAANGAEALEAIESSAPDIVLLDMRMPILDGRGFAREIRARGIALKIIVMTAARDAGSSASEIDAHGVLAKPFRMDDLLSALDAVRGTA